MSAGVYGVQPTGFNRKPLSVTLTELEAALITEFGPDVVQTPQSPLGQINGLMADLITQLWEFSEDIYQAYDPDQAEGLRLDTLGKIRLLRRQNGELDPAFRRAITNQGQARIDIQDIERAVQNVEGVTYAHVFINDLEDLDEVTLIPPGTICVAVLGGDDAEIATQIRRYVVPGISTYGNTYVSTTADGYCRTVTILRPILINVQLQITIRTTNDIYGCPPPSITTIRDVLVDELMNGERRLLNGDNIDHFRLRSVLESNFPNVELISFTGERNDLEGGLNIPVNIAFIEKAVLIKESVVLDAI